MVKVSVIVPVYNVETYLEQCLDSVVNQTLKDIEIILVNDGSTDQSEKICRRYADKDDRIRLITQNNQGLAAARQSGLEAARGEYVGFVDSDDWLEPDMYEKMYKAAHNGNADIVFCNVYRNENKKGTSCMASGYYDRARMEAEIFPRLLAGFSEGGGDVTLRWSNCLRLYKKSLIDENHIAFDKRFRRCQDLPFTFECTIHAQSYYYLGEEYLYHNRMNYESLSKGYTKNMWSLLKPLLEYLREKVDGYKMYDFREQMLKRYALFAFESGDNETKPNNRRSMKERRETIRSIMNDEDVRKVMKAIRTKGMRRIYKLYVFCYRRKLVRLFYFLSDKRYVARKKEYARLSAAEQSKTHGENK